MIDKIGGRKFVGFIFITCILLVLVVIGKIEAKELLLFITGNYGLYVLGNVGNKAVTPPPAQ